MLHQPDSHWMKLAINASQTGLSDRQGGPFGAAIVQGETLIALGCNQVTSQKDPTAHAEMVAIRQACQALNRFQLTGCDLYTTCEPCPMCLGAIYWARLDRVYYANTRFDAAAIGFDDQFIYEELNQPDSDRKIPFIHCPSPEAWAVFQQWQTLADKILY